MRLGLLARADQRGLGLMSWAAQRFLDPVATLVVDAQQGYPMHLDRFPGAAVTQRTSSKFRPAAEKLLDRIDVLLTLETPYNWRLYDWAAGKDVRTVLVAMPEYHKPYMGLSQPDLIVNPTPYMHEMFPHGVVLPWPVECNMGYRHRERIGEWLHVVGQVADDDRAGTRMVVEAFSAMPDQKLVIRVQNHRDSRLRKVLAAADRMDNVTVLGGETSTVAELYERGDALIALRRYAGQSLPANEAAAAGLPLVCLDRVPDAAWTLPELVVPAFSVAGPSRFGYEVHSATIPDIVTVVEKLAADPLLVASASLFSRARALAMSWEALKDPWLAVLAGS